MSQMRPFFKHETLTKHSFFVPSDLSSYFYFSRIIYSSEWNFTQKLKWSSNHSISIAHSSVDWIIHLESPSEYLHSILKSESDVTGTYFHFSQVKHSFTRNQNLFQARVKCSSLRLGVAIFSPFDWKYYHTFHTFCHSVPRSLDSVLSIFFKHISFLSFLKAVLFSLFSSTYRSISYLHAHLHG